MVHHKQHKKVQQEISSEFYFKPKLKKINWRTLSSLNVDEIVSNNNVNSLHGLIEMITFCDITNSEMEGVDPNMIKIFRLSQLIIEFLLHSQSCLLKEREDDLEQCKSLIESKTLLQRDLEQSNREVENSKKEIKSLKKALFVYELMSKKPGKGEYYQCQYCPKAFSTVEYRIGHEKRRHPGLMSPKEPVPLPKAEPKEEKPSKELLKVVELIEIMTKSQKHEQELQEQKDLELKSEKLLNQEKLKFEKEMQELTAKMHQKMEEEMFKLKQDREAFENLVNAQGKQISHVGNLEDDEEKEEKKHSEELLEMKRQHQQEIELVQQRMIQEMQILKESMRVDQSRYSQALEDQLAYATREIEYLKAKQVEKQQVSESIQVEPIVVRNVSIPEIVIPPVVEKIEPVVRKEPPLPPKIPSMEKFYSAPSPTSSTHHLLGWKQYLDVLKGKSIIQHPMNKYANGMYQHHHSEIEGKKELIRMEMDQFMSDYGLTPTTVAKGLADPSIQSCFQQLSDIMQKGRESSKKKMYYEEMRQYLDTVLDSAASQTTDFSVVPPMARKSSLRKSTLRPSSPKNVRISEFQRERIISIDDEPACESPKKRDSHDRLSKIKVDTSTNEKPSKPKKPTLNIVELTSPVDQQTVETMEKLRQMTPNPTTPQLPSSSPYSQSQLHAMSPYSQYFGGTPTSASPLKRSLSNTKEKVSQAFSKVAKSLFHHNKRGNDTRFETAMAQYQTSNNQLNQPVPNQPYHQYNQPIPNQAYYQPSPNQPYYPNQQIPQVQPPPPPPKKTRKQTESSDATSSAADSETESSYYTSETSTVSSPKRQPPAPPKKVTVVKVPEKNSSESSFSVSDPTESKQETDDEDLLEFLDEIDVPPEPKKEAPKVKYDAVPTMDDIEDFDD